MEKASIFEYEQKFAGQGYDLIIGIDEAGRGPLAGPVVACAVALRGNSSREADFPEFGLIRDSKKLSEKQRENLHDFICQQFYVGVGMCDHITVDRINVLEATYLAMKKAVASLMREISNDKLQMSNKIPNPKFQNSKYLIHDAKYILLVDGNKIIPNCSYEQKAIIGGDKIVKSISAASIIAKVTRDRIMREMDAKYPQYGFLKHKGYGTLSHREAIKKHGPCYIHRRSFRLI